MSKLIMIDGKRYDVPIVKLDHSAEFLYKYAERTVDGVLHSEMIGVYFNYQVVFGKNNANPTEYKKLYDKLTEPSEFHSVRVPTIEGEHAFEAYFSNIKDTFVRIKGDNRYFKGLSVNIIARRPARQ